MSFSVRDLQIGEMISVSASWLDPEHKPTFLSIPEIAPLVGRLEAMHASLVAARESAFADAELRVLSERADNLDDRHDNLARALYYLLMAAQYHALGQGSPDESRADAVERAMIALFPNALNAVIASYQAEAGNAEQLENLAKGELAPLLSSIHIEKNVTAVDIASAIGVVGKQLGMIEHQKTQAAAAAEKKSLGAAEIKQRMRAWASLAETLLGNLEHSSAAPESIEAIRAPLVAAAEKASARRRDKQAAKPKGSKEAPAPEGKTDG
jgi:hypothetical protein